jgi:hypothetical protein
MFEFLKLYPNKTGFFVGAAIGLATYAFSTSLCTFANGCPNGNPFYEFAMSLGSLVVGIYCSWLIQGQLQRIIIGFMTTLITIFVVLKSGARGVIDGFLNGENFLSYVLLYGFITLIFSTGISLINPQK